MDEYRRYEELKKQQDLLLQKEEQRKSELRREASRKDPNINKENLSRYRDYREQQNQSR